MLPVILGLEGPSLTSADRERIDRHQPAGFILFSRNIESAEQVRALTDELRELCGHLPFVGIDNEGGRVWRTAVLGPTPPDAATFATKATFKQSAWFGALAGRQLEMLGINFDFAPVLDIDHPDELPNPANPRQTPKTKLDSPHDQGRNQNPPAGSGQTSSGSHRAARQHLASGSDGTSEEIVGWRSESRQQADRLLGWSRQVGLDQGEPLDEGPVDGSEHRVAFDVSRNEWLKQTHPGIGYGVYPVLEEVLDSQTQSGKTSWNLRPATPLEYLERLDLSQEIFGDDARLSAVLDTVDGPVIQIRQHHLKGGSATSEEIRDFMAGLGFQAVDEGWWRREDGTFAGDTHRANFVKDSDGHVLPFDIVLARPRGELRDYFDSRTKPGNALRGRCWGRESQGIIDHAGNFNRWLRKNGVLSCGKHFPAGGRARVDPHHDLPVVDATVEELLASDLIPYTALMPELDAIMIAHIRYPAIDAEFPSSLSRRIITDLLRNQLGYEGLVLTDDLDMGAITGHYGRGRDFELAWLAGNDLPLLCHELDSLGIVAAVYETLPAPVRIDIEKRLEKKLRKLPSPPPFRADKLKEANRDLASLTREITGLDSFQTTAPAQSPVEDY